MPTAAGARRISASVRPAPIGASVMRSASHLRTISAIAFASDGAMIKFAQRASAPDGGRRFAAPTIAAKTFARFSGSWRTGGTDFLERDLTAWRGHFHAGSRRRNYLVGIGAPLWIEHAPQLAHHDQVVGRKDERHLGHFLNADAVLAGQAAA